MSFLHIPQSEGSTPSNTENFSTFAATKKKSKVLKKMTSKKTTDAKLLQSTLEIIKRKKITDTLIAKKVGVSNPVIKDIMKQDKVKTATVESFKKAFPDEYNLALLEKQMPFEDFFSRFSKLKISKENSLKIRKEIRNLFVAPEKWVTLNMKAEDYFKKVLGSSWGQPQILGLVGGKQLDMHLSISRIKKLYRSHPKIAIAIRPILDDEFKTQQQELMGTSKKLDKILENIKKISSKDKDLDQLDVLTKYIEGQLIIEKERRFEYTKKWLNQIRIKILEGGKVDNEFIKNLLEEIEADKSKGL